MKYWHIIALASAVGFTAAVIAHKPVRGQSIWDTLDANGNSVMTGQSVERAQPRIVYPTYYRQAADGTVVEVKREPTPVNPFKNSFDIFMDNNYIYVGIGLAICLGILIGIYLRLKDRESDHEPWEQACSRQFDQHLSEYGPFGQGGIGPVLRKLSIHESELRERGAEAFGIGLSRHNRNFQIVPANHGLHSCLGSWASHINRVKAERKLANI